MRAGIRTDQPLRLPGQELAMTWEGPEENYNIFRWYKAGWGRYTQADAIDVSEGDINAYRYALSSPTRYTDPLGLDVRMCCRPIDSPRLAAAGYLHCYIESNTNGRRETWGLNNIETRGPNYGEPRKNYPKDKGGRCTPWRKSNTCDDGQCFTREMNKYPYEHYSYVRANIGFPFSTGNSNTFARCLWNKCRSPRDYAPNEWEVLVGFAGRQASGWMQPCPNF